MTRVGTLSAYLQAAWSLSAPVGTANIHWDENWYDSKYTTPQITITNQTSGLNECFNTGGSLDMIYLPYYVVNVWQPVRRGNIGTQEAQNAEDMRREVAKIFRESQFLRLGAAFGGSLSPFGVVVPLDMGRPLHELDKSPRILRYEITLMTTSHNE